MKSDDNNRPDGKPATLGTNVWQIIDKVPAFVWCASPDGSIEFLNHRGLAYTGFSLEQIRGWSWKETNILHPDDMEGLYETWSAIVASGNEGEIQARMKRFDGEYKWFLFRVAPLRDDSGRLIGWLGVDIEIDERKRTQDQLRRSESYLAEAQKLSHTGSFGWHVSSGKIYWSDETYRIFQFEPTTQPTLERAFERIHPEDQQFARQVIDSAAQERRDFDFEYRLLMPGGSVKCVRVVGHPSTKDDSGELVFVGAVTDVTERKRGEEEMQKLASLAENSTDFIGMASLQGEVLFVNATGQAIVGLAGNEQVRGTMIPDYIAEQDLERFNAEVMPSVFKDGRWEGETLFRHFKSGASIPMWQHVFFITDEVGRRLALATISRDITERKRAEETLRRSEGYLAEAQRLTRAGSWAWSAATRGSIHWSQEHYRLFGFDPEKGIPPDAVFHQRIHPEDRDRVVETFDRAMFRERTDFDVVYRIALPEGAIKYVRSVGHPVFDLSGDLLEYVGTAMDVTEQHEARATLETAFAEIKILKDRLYEENVLLKEEIDKTSMFEEIVGESAALQTVLARVTKVAPTNSTVLVTGETGTGKELIARAIHKRSQRAKRAFVSINCAAIPPSLIASELFGHEKGAFTGATQRHLGRFELAEGGTIFLDEIGDLPLDTQIALLRVLQEREFERVGGAKVIRADVRVIAATNRDLQGSVDAGTFRSDLYYRVNVFPIEIPPLRKRREDIPLLVEYFIDRYTSKAGKKIQGINRATLEKLKSYAWPGNIRELQNVIERSVIVCETENFTIDESWLSPRLEETNQAEPSLLRMPASQEKKTIEAALAEAGGRVAGPSGAAAKLGIPPSTLDSKIKTLGINKHRFKMG